MMTSEELAEKKQRLFGANGFKLRRRTNINAIGTDGEIDVCAWLNRHGFKAQKMRRNHSFDVLCNGKRIEVKTALYVNSKWMIGVRDTQVGGGSADLFIIQLRHPERKYPTYLVVPSFLILGNFSITDYTLPFWLNYRNALWYLLE